MTLNPDLTRRGFLSASALSILALAACSNESGSSSGGTAFTYKDARGKEIELDKVPEIVVAQSSAAAALWDNGFKVKGVYGELPDPLDYQAGNIDLSQMTVLGRTYGEFNIEQFTALRPELLIDMTFDKENLWYAADVEAQITKIAPTIGMQLTDLSLLQQIDSFTELAKKLGATPDNAAPKSDFEAAAARIAEAAKANPDLTVVGLSVGTDQVSFANTPAHPDLAYLAELGVKFPTISPDELGIFEAASFENIGKYQADVILVDARDFTGFESIKNMDVWKNLPAVVAGQQYNWYPVAPYSYQGYAKFFGEYATNLSAAKKLA